MKAGEADVGMKRRGSQLEAVSRVNISKPDHRNQGGRCQPAQTEHGAEEMAVCKGLRLDPAD
jgi:hypothetical protein